MVKSTSAMIYNTVWGDLFERTLQFYYHKLRLQFSGVLKCSECVEFRVLILNLQGVPKKGGVANDAVFVLLHS